MSRTPAFAALAAAALLSACAAPYAGAPAVAANVETIGSPGVVAYHPDLIQEADFIRVHGVVCRQAARPATGRVDVHVEHLDGAGRVVERTAARLPADLNARNRTCGIYNVAAAWVLAPGDTVRVCAAAAGRVGCAPEA